MKIALFSDLHGDASGLELLLKHEQFIKSDERICLGDVVEFKDACWEYYERLAQADVTIIKGNHEAVLTGECDVTVFNPKVHAAIERAKEDVRRTKPEFLDTLRALPMRLERDGAFFTHGSFQPQTPWKHIRYIEDLAAEAAHTPGRITFLAHGHIPFVAWQENGLWFYERQLYGRTFQLERDQPYILNTGSILGSREMRWLEKTYLLFDSDAQTATYYNLSTL